MTRARPRFRPGRRTVGEIVAFLGMLAVGAILHQETLRSDRWKERTSAFVAQFNALGQTLKPGGVGVVHLAPGEADELIVLPAYASRNDLERLLPGRPPGLIDRFLVVSSDDQTSPALVWLRNGRVLAINRAGFLVGVNVRCHSWSVVGGRDFRVRKQESSPNSFLDLIVLEGTNRKIMPTRRPD